MKTSPMMFFLGTAPHARESQDEARLSPMKKYMPDPTRQVPCRPPARPGLMYGSLIGSPLIESTLCSYLTVSPGSLRGGCRISGDRLVARCFPGKGIATVVADADLLNPEALGAGADHNLDGLTEELAALEHR